MASENCRQIVWLFLFANMLSLPGCGGHADIEPASGIILINGKPACEGRVVFLPVGGGKPALGQIDDSGRFNLSSYSSGDGAKIAEHHIVLKDVRCQGDDDTTDYRAMQATRVTVASDAENDFEINVVLGKGWQEVNDK